VETQIISSVIFSYKIAAITRRALVSKQASRDLAGKLDEDRSLDGAREHPVASSGWNLVTNENSISQIAKRVRFFSATFPLATHG